MRHSPAWPAVLAVLLITVGVVPAGATPVTFNFSGNVTSVAAALAGTFNTTQTLSGSLTFDSALVDSDPNAGVGSYHQLSAFSFSIGAYSGTQSASPTSSGIEIYNNYLGFDGVQVYVSPIAGASIGTWSPIEFLATMYDYTQTAFSSAALPVVPPSAALFSDRAWYLAFRVGTTDNIAFVGGRNFQLTAAQPVPEPATLSLIGLGLAGGALRLRRKLRR